MNRLRIFGDSHVAQLRAAAAHLPGRPRPLEFQSNHGWNWVEFTLSCRNGRAHCAADRVPGHPPLDYTLGPPEALHFFSSPLHSAPVVRDVAWRRFCPWELAASQPQLMALSDAALESWFDSQLDCRWALLRQLLAHGYRLAVVEPPRPLRRAPRLFGLAPEVVLAVDRHWRAHVRRWLAGQGVPVIEVPAESIGPDGFTRDDYAHENPDDPHHGNTAFATGMLRRILEFAGS